MLNILDIALDKTLQIKQDFENSNIDLAITNVEVNKISEDDEKNLIRYSATIYLKNEGAYIKDLKILVNNSSDLSFVILKNTETGLSLQNDAIYVYKGYEFDWDKSFSGGEIVFEVKPLEDTVYDIDPVDNKFKVFIDNKFSTFSDLYPKAINLDNSIKLEADLSDYVIGDKSYELLIGNKLKYDKRTEVYKEALLNNQIYSYFNIPLTKEVFESGNFRKTNPIIEFPVDIALYDDPFASENPDYYMLLKINFSENNHLKFKYSDVIKFTSNKTLTRAEAAKIFVEQTGEKSLKGVKMHYQDIDKTDWFYNYVSTLYGLGLLDMDSFSFNPAGPMTRMEALIMALNYYDIDLINVKKVAPIFKDITPNDPNYHFVQALNATTISSGFTDYFKADAPITKHFLTNLIYALRENN
ncbi:protein containing S-layer domain [sediment metagenome]|uniref:Protein containing S-layer domain n=1 Tax=sediment metagenome TaxID=749907 RepID=D9PNH2_9ZZZZ